MRWWDWYPERKKAELEALSARGITYIEDQGELERGFLVIHFRFKVGGQELELHARFPEFYPYFPPDLFAPSGTFARHQSPAGGHLCLVGRNSRQWFSNTLMIELVEDRLPDIVAINSTYTEPEIKAVEEPQGEPLSEYFNGNALCDSTILYNPINLDVENWQKGQLHLELEEETNDKKLTKTNRGWVEKIIDAEKREFAKWEQRTPPVKTRKFTIPVVSLREAPSGNLQDLIDGLSEDDNRHLGLSREKNKISSKNPVWMFAVAYKQEVTQFQFGGGLTIFRLSFDPRRAKQNQVSVEVLRTHRYSPADLVARSPGLEKLESKSVAVFGLGALGSSIAWEAARAGIGRLYLVDFDIVDPMTTRRWAFGWPAFGKRKAPFLEFEIRRNHPSTIVTPITLRLGMPLDQSDPPNQYDLILNILSDCDVVVDASAELSVSHLLAAMCREFSKDFVIANATPGVWGGMVAAFENSSNTSPCWICLREALYSKRTITLPNSDPNGEVQPPSCAAITFTGTGFDMNEISLETVRTCVGILSDGDYPKRSLSLALVNLREADGSRSVVNWTETAIPLCDACSAK